MKSNRFTPKHVAVCIALAASLIAVTGAAQSQPDTGAPAAAALRQQHWQEHLQAKLNRMAERLQITPSQQPTWTAYADAVKNLAGPRPARPGADADAAGIVRYRAKLAGERAQKLSRLADATAALQQVLNPEQQKALNKMVRHRTRHTFGRHGY